jgi:outer membrane lipoprotein-sorting protein
MIKKIVIFYFFLNLFNPLFSASKIEVIQKLEKINNLTFNFKQTIDDKTEEGNCIIEYPKKIYCSYNGLNKKIMVSNGKSLVIKNKNINQYYIYPLKRTPLDLILNKKYLINEIKDLNGRIIDNKYLNFTLINNDNKINIFFDNKTLNLVGWQTEDIYQNLVITFISSIKINQKINKKKFKLPKNN